METLKKRSTMAIWDDRQAWKDRHEGKALVIDQADYGTQHIFFDDQANA